MYCMQIVFRILLSSTVATLSSDFHVVSTTTNPSSINTSNSLHPLELKITILQERPNRQERSASPDMTLLPLHLLSTHPKDCKVYKDKGATITGLYRIQPDLSSPPFLVLCDMQTREGGWTYLMNRYDGSQNFDLPWDEYKGGFGNLNGEFWLGLDKMHALTDSNQVSEVLIELVDWQNKKVYAHYNYFKIGDGKSGYILKVDEFSGDAGDSFHIQDGQKFSTKDKDQDFHKDLNCAKTYNGGWWYLNCYRCKLTGKYIKGNTTSSDGIHWESFHPNTYSLKQVRMMLRSRELWK